jgi:hypothetical protein
MRKHQCPLCGVVGLWKLTQWKKNIEGLGAYFLVFLFFMLYKALCRWISSHRGAPSSSNPFSSLLSSSRDSKPCNSKPWSHQISSVSDAGEHKHKKRGDQNEGGKWAGKRKGDRWVGGVSRSSQKKKWCQGWWGKKIKPKGPWEKKRW